MLCDFEVSSQLPSDETDKDATVPTYWQLQVEQVEFVRVYKYMLMSSTRLTRYQEEQLAQVGGSEKYLAVSAVVAAGKVFKTLIESVEGVLFVAPCKSLCWIPDLVQTAFCFLASNSCASPTAAS